MKGIRKALCVLLIAVLTAGSVLVPSQAAGMDALMETLQALRATATPQPTETPAPQEDAPADELPAPEAEASSEPTPDKGTEGNLNGLYVKVKAGAAAFRNAKLTTWAGVFEEDGYAFAVSLMDNYTELVFVNSNNGRTTDIYVASADVTMLSNEEATRYRVALAIKGATRYEGVLLPSIAFEVLLGSPTPVPTDTPKPTSKPTSPPPPTPDPKAWRKAPTNLEVTTNKDLLTVTLTWTGNDYCTGYAVYQQLEDGYKVLGTVSGPENTTFTTKGLGTGTYTFYVKPKNGSAVGNASDTVTIEVKDGKIIPTPSPTPVPAEWRTAPTDGKGTCSPDTGKVTLTWKGNPYCSGYAIYRKLNKTENGKNYEVMGAVSGADTNSFTTKKMSFGEYTFYIRPRNGSAVGEASKDIKVSVPHVWWEAPTEVTMKIDHFEPTKATLSWAENEKCDSYAVYQLLEDGSYKVLGITKETQFTIKSSEPGEYTYCVKPRKGSAVGDASDEVTFIFPPITHEGIWGWLSWKLYSGRYGQKDAKEDIGTLVIEGSGDMDDFTASSTEAWRKYRARVFTVVVKPGVTSIGNYAFRDCTSLLRVNIADSVTKIGSNAFYHSGDEDLTEIILPNGLKTIGESAFQKCAHLTIMQLPDNLETIGTKAFADCTGLSFLTISEKVSTIGERAFYGCTKLSAVTIPGNVTSFGPGLFENCTTLDNAVIQDGVTQIGTWAFVNCKALQSVTIPKSVVLIGDWAFDSCNSLKTVNYTGTQDEWNSVKIGFGNGPLEKAKPQK